MLHSDTPHSGAQKLIDKSRRWQQLAVAVVASVSLWGASALALSLGRVAVQSALGEPLRAEVEVLNINAEEAASLATGIASPESFKAAGLDYSATTANIKASLQRMPDGRAYIRLSSDHVINEPFIDLILETNWASGRIVRDYTLLFDPPSLRRTAPIAPTAAQVPVEAAAGQPRAARTGASPAAPTAAEALSRAPRPAAKVVPAGSGSFTVKAGDTASKIAAAARPDSVSLDQMLVALLRANPQAFVGNNVNRIKAGAVVTLPSPEQAVATPAAEATQMIVAQSRDFNDFRRKLAASAPDTTLATADRNASGTVQARVEDKKPVATSPDKLTLSKGTVQKLSAQDQLAKERSARDRVERAAEIARNISDLGKLGAASSAAVGRPATAAPPASAAAAVKGPVVPASAPQTGVIDGLMDSPLLPAGAIGLIALLVIYGLYRTRKHRGVVQVAEFPPEGGSGPEAYFAVNGGQSVDTQDGAASGATVVYEPSRPAGVDATDPIAEAQVYLTYGRDLQAEEILKEALVAHPERLAIHQKLLELLAKRNDAAAFEETAEKAFRLTQGQGAEWQRICELGLSLDEKNPRYLPGWRPVESAAESTPAPTLPALPVAPEAPQVPAPVASSKPAPQSQAAPAQTGNSADLDLDLDLDFSLDEDPADAPLETSDSVAQTAPAKLPNPPAAATEPTPPVPAHDMLEFDLGSLSLDLDEVAQEAPAPVAQAPADPLATKLALAEEFKAIGDLSGARTLIEEVVAEAAGDMKLKAQRALGNLQA